MAKNAKTSVLEINHQERGVMINALNTMRTGLLKDGKHTDAVDDILLKVIDAPPKRGGLFSRRRGRDEAR